VTQDTLDDAVTNLDLQDHLEGLVSQAFVVLPVQLVPVDQKDLEGLLGISVPLGRLDRKDHKDVLVAEDVQGFVDHAEEMDRLDHLDLEGLLVMSSVSLAVFHN